MSVLTKKTEEIRNFASALPSPHQAAAGRAVCFGLADWKTLRVYKPRVRRFLDFCQSAGVIYVGELNAGLLMRYQSFLREKGFNSRTIAQEQRTTVKALLQRAWREQLIPEDLTASLPPIVRAAKTKPRVYTRAEIAGILRAMRRQRHLRRRTTFLRFALYTDCRKEQARSLRWADLDLEARTVRLIGQKGIGPRVIPLTRRLVRMLGRIKREGDFVFGTFDHKAPGYWLHQAGKDAGLQGSYRWHDLRSTVEKSECPTMAATLWRSSVLRGSKFLSNAPRGDTEQRGRDA